MKLTVISNDKGIIDNLMGCRKNLQKKYQRLLELNAYDPVSLQDEASTLKMYDDIEGADICILDINNNTGYPLLLNIIYTCMSCSGYIIPSNFNSTVSSFLHLGMLTIKDITGINPKSDIDSNYMSMLRIVRNIEEHGSVLLGKYRDLRNYAKICEYVEAGDAESMNKLLTLLAEEYCGSFCNKRHIS